MLATCNFIFIVTIRADVQKKNTRKKEMGWGWWVGARGAVANLFRAKISRQRKKQQQQQQQKNCNIQVSNPHRKKENVIISYNTYTLHFAFTPGLDKNGTRGQLFTYIPALGNQRQNIKLVLS